MEVTWGVVIVVLGLLCWGGQAISLLAPKTAVRLTLMEAEETVEPTYSADIRAEALWDVLTLWVLVLAGVLLIADQVAWAYFGLVGGGMYVYFAGRGVSARAVLRRRGFQSRFGGRGQAGVRLSRDLGGRRVGHDRSCCSGTGIVVMGNSGGEVTRKMKRWK